MRRIILVALCFGLVSSRPPTCAAADDAVSKATVDDCFGCVLGIWDSIELTNTAGCMDTGVPTDLFIGIKFDPAAGFDASTGIDCRISGFLGLILGGPQPLVPGAPLCPSPVDSAGVLTLNCTWGTCLHGSQALAKVTIISLFQLWDHVLQVIERPPWQHPVILLCDAPAFTAVYVTGGRYRLNSVPACREAIEGRAWSSVKQLFR
jgi:hypothetical protein